MALRNLRTRFLLSSGLLVLMTAASGAWGVFALTRLGEAVDATLDESEETIVLAASLATAIEREDDALLRIATGKADRGEGGLTAERERFEEAFARLAPFLKEPDERITLGSIRRNVEIYRAAGDRMLTTPVREDAWEVYHVNVNPALRGVVADCERVRELHFRGMRQTGIQARDRARRAAAVVGGILAAAVVTSILVASRLARAVVPPVLDLTRSVEALSRGDFDRRVSVTSADELGRLAAGFNQMAETLAEFRRLNLDEVIRARRPWSQRSPHCPTPSSSSIHLATSSRRTPRPRVCSGLWGSTRFGGWSNSRFRPTAWTLCAGYCGGMEPELRGPT